MERRWRRKKGEEEETMSEQVKRVTIDAIWTGREDHFLLSCHFQKCSKKIAALVKKQKKNYDRRNFHHPIYKLHL